MRDRDAERAARREYEADVYYEVWQSQGNPDAIDFDRVRDHYDGGLRHEESAAIELHSQRPTRRDEDEQET